MPSHKFITDPDIHEPKGVITAPAGTLYRADGSGSGQWLFPFAGVGVRTAFDFASPQTRALTTTPVVLDLTTSTDSADRFSVLTSPNLRMRYNGTQDGLFNVNLAMSVKQSSGGSRDIEHYIYKNGVAVFGGRVVSTYPDTAYVNVNVVCDVPLSTNDYLEVWARTQTSTCTAQIVGFYLSIRGETV